VGTTKSVATFDRDQIDMLSATSVRFVITMGPSVCAAEATLRQSTHPTGTSWYPLSEKYP